MKLKCSFFSFFFSLFIFLNIFSSFGNTLLNEEQKKELELLLTPLGKNLMKEDGIMDLNEILEYPIVECSIHEEPFYIQVRTDWSPLGSQRFLDLIEDNYFDHSALFRALKDFIVQFGISGDMEKAEKWARSDPLPDEIPNESEEGEREGEGEEEEGEGEEGEDSDEEEGREARKRRREKKRQRRERERQREQEPVIPKIPFTRGIMSFAGSGPDSRQTQMFFTLVDTDWLGRSSWEQPFAKIVYNLDILDTIFYGYGEQPDQGKIWNEGYEYLKKEFPKLTYLDYCRQVRDDEIFQKNSDEKEGRERDNIQNEAKDGQDKNMEQFGYRVYLIELVLVSIVLISLYCVIYRLARSRSDKAE